VEWGTGEIRRNSKFEMERREEGRMLFFFFEKEKREVKTREGSGPEMLSLAQP
jgi:hypothetical protein